MALVDANVILRYLLDDHEELSARAAEIIEKQDVTLTTEVACEVVYVLQKVYGVERRDIQTQLVALLDDRLVRMAKPAVVAKALECFSQSTLDFVDALLWAYHQIDHESIVTFDVKLNKALQGTDADSLSDPRDTAPD